MSGASRMSTASWMGEARQARMHWWLWGAPQHVWVTGRYPRALQVVQVKQVKLVGLTLPQLQAHVGMPYAPHSMPTYVQSMPVALTLGACGAQRIPRPSPINK